MSSTNCLRAILWDLKLGKNPGIRLVEQEWENFPHSNNTRCPSTHVACTSSITREIASSSSIKSTKRSIINDDAFINQGRGDILMMLDGCNDNLGSDI